MRSLPIIRNPPDLPYLSHLVSKEVIQKTHDHHHHHYYYHYQMLLVQEDLLRRIVMMTDQVTVTTIRLLHVTANMIAEEAEAVAVKGHEVIIIMTETAVGETKNENSIRLRQIEVVPVEEEVEVEVGVQKERKLLGIVTEEGIIEEENNLKRGLWTLDSGYRALEKQKI